MTDFTPTDPAPTDLNPAPTNPASTNPASTNLAPDDQISSQGRKGSKIYADNASVDRIPPHPQLTTVERMRGPMGLMGLIKNPYVFATAIFASIGGLLCKDSTVKRIYIWT